MTDQLQDDLIHRLKCKYPLGPIVDGEPEMGWRDFSGPAPEGMVLPTRLMLEAADEIGRLRDENAICRNAIEDAVHLVTDWSDENDDDISQGAARATRRRLSEAIGKATPRLMYEKPGGQKFYGLHWREMREEIGRLQDERDALLRFAGAILSEHREHMSDVDGGTVQDAALAAGLLEECEAVEACGDGCECFDFPTTCMRYTEVGKLAVESAS